MFKAIYQSFDETSNPAQGPARLAALRAKLNEMGLDGFLVPRSDEHQNEYVAKSSERLAWLTGFTGSAGLCVVLSDRAAIFVDGRYTLQVREQVDVKSFTPQHLINEPPEAWVEANLKKGARLGFDPWLHTAGMVKRFEQAAKAAGAELVAVSHNPIDAIWQDRPAPPIAAVHLHAKRHAGETADKKIAALQKALGKADALVVSDPHSVAWAFNMRGGDVGHTPLPLSFALIRKEGRPSLYLDGRKLSNSVRAHLADSADVADPSLLLKDLAALGKAKKTVQFDAATAPALLSQTLEEAGGKAEIGADPSALMKARKNRHELAGTRAAHLRDAAAYARFLAWFAEEAPKGKQTEISAAEALETFRRDGGKLKDVSFPSISGAGPNAAIPHYRVSRTSNRKIGKGIFLIDSGAQYEDGTTDITRTLVVGKPTAEMRDRFTRVLKGHIAIATSVFPKGTSGAQIDAFARQALWQAGLDFDHGTGHGVGSYLSVHEGPQRIAKTGTTPLEPGMILSNEPGYYKAGAWGIRIENLIVVEKREIKGAEREMYGFETISFSPIERALVDVKLLTAEERAWLNAYHAEVKKRVAPLVDPATRKWLTAATKPL
ncbi:aminopeptidase P family protein [Methylovirgula sp. 4M-Z18]|uniref:aminopeptidase P family protein n=1 Tax=Methylovirgula sp. 4M-Z18 TaxID=2293567 RepID=UPI000E2F8735|nr:aminopeptidase P family protein [Methylovirgula sp. 4M-Z18]RFB79594.1 aminopeptidase P family protein [Methylovirgula sp. 4M-Z18]